MNCSDVDELLAAYALDAVDPGERAAIEAHLDTCDLHDEVAELLAAASVLAVLTEDREPSATLEARVLASAAERAPSPVADDGRGRSRPRVLSLAWPAAAAAAVLIGAVGFGAGALMMAGTGEPGTETEMVVQVVQEGGAFMRAEAHAGAAPVRVTLAGLQRLPDEAGYQVWAVRNDDWMTVGVCNTDDDGWWEGNFDFALDMRDDLVVTVEPREGSPAPSGPVVLRSTAWERSGQ